MAKAADHNLLLLLYLSKIVKPSFELFESYFAVIAFFTLGTGDFAELLKFIFSDELCALTRVHTAVSGDIMQQWLKRVKPSIQLTTYRGYRDNVCSIIIPYFKPLELKLKDVTAQQVTEIRVD